MNKQPFEPYKAILWGVLLILGAWGVGYYLRGNPFDELALIRRAQITTGFLVETQESDREDVDEQGDIGVYTYSLPDGRTFKATTHSAVSPGQLQEHQEVEYLPDNPAVSRIRGDGCRSVMGWLWLTVVTGGILLAIFVIPGIRLLRNGVRDIRRSGTGSQIKTVRSHEDILNDINILEGIKIPVAVAVQPAATSGAKQPARTIEDTLRDLDLFGAEGEVAREVIQLGPDTKRKEVIAETTVKPASERGTSRRAQTAWSQGRAPSTRRGCAPPCPRSDRRCRPCTPRPRSRRGRGRARYREKNPTSLP